MEKNDAIRAMMDGKNVSLVKIAWLLGHCKVSPALFRYARISQTSQLYEEVNLL